MKIKMAYSVVAIFFILLSATCEPNEESREENMSDVMRHDGVKRVVALTSKNIEKLLKKNDLVVVMFWIDNQKGMEQLSEKDMEFLEVTAQLFKGSKVAVATCELLGNQKFAVKAGVKYTGMVKIFNKGRPTDFFGQRSADVLFPYLAKMISGSVGVIQTKAEKKHFDMNDLPKVIAYMEPKSKEFKAFSDASLYFQPMIPFYVVHDSKLAKAFHLKKLNSIQLLKPYEKAVTFSAKKGVSERTVATFVNENKRQRITKMRMENLHEVWAIDTKGYVVPVFASAKTEEGIQFFSLIKSVAKHFEKNENLSFIWIDPEPFVAMLDYWTKAFEIDPMVPNIGVVDVHTQTSAWYKKSPEGSFVVNEVKKWMNDVVNKKIELKPMKATGPKQADSETTSEESEENESESRDEL